MVKAGSTHDITIASGGTTKGFMLLRPDGSLRRVTVQDFRTIAPRQLSDAELTHAQLPVEVELVWFQEEWRGGLGGINHRFSGDSTRIASAVKVDASQGSYLALARDVVLTTTDYAPSEYVPSGFAISGSSPWVFFGRYPYSWDYPNKRWQRDAVPLNAECLYRSGVPYGTNAFCSRWADDAGSSGSYTATDEPCSYIYRALGLDQGDATNWVNVDGIGSTNPDAFKYFAVADSKMWGGYVVDAADSTEDTLNSPVFDATGSTSDSATTSVTHSHTVLASSQNRLLLVGISIEDGAPADPSGVTYNGVAMTKVSSVTNSTAHAALYQLVAPATGANNVVVSFSSTMDDVVVGAVSFTNVDQTTPLGTAVTNTGSSTTPTVSVTAVVGNVVVDVVGHTGTTTPTVNGSQTQMWNSAGGASNSRHFASRETAGGTTVAMDWSGAANSAWASVGVAVKHTLSTATSTTFGVTAAPATNLTAGDVIRVDSELMLVTVVSDTPTNHPYVTVVRGYRGSVAAVHNTAVNIYKMTENSHHIRSTINPTGIANWSSGVEIGDASSEITALIGVDTLLYIFKTDGIYSYDGTDVVELRPEFKAQVHPEQFRGAFAWNDRILLPLHGGGMLELDTSDNTIRDISFSLVAPDQTQFHGQIAAMHGGPTHLYLLVLDPTTGADKYHLLMAQFITISGTTDYRWHHLGEIAYTTGTDFRHAALMLEASTGHQDDHEHHRLLVGIENTGGSTGTGSDRNPHFYAHDTHDVDHDYTNDSTEAITVRWDGNLPKVDKQFSSITCRSDNVGSRGGSNHYIEVKYRVDGGSWTYVTGTNTTSTLTTSTQMISFASGITGKVLELKFILVRKTSDNNTTPKMLDFTVTAQLRPVAVKTIPLTMHLADHQRLLNGALGGTPKSDLAQLRTWNAQAAEVTLEMPSGPSGTTSRTCVFLPGVMREEEIAHEAGRRSEYAVTVLLAEV